MKTTIGPRVLKEYVNLAIGEYTGTGPRCCCVIAARRLMFGIENALEVFCNLGGQLRGVFYALYEFALFVDDVE